MVKTKNTYARLEIDGPVSNTHKPNAFSLALLNIKKGFTSLDTCPKELYINFCLKYCESYGYFSISQILVIYLHTEFGASDIESGTVYGVWGLCITFWGLLTSYMNDNLGVRKALLIGFTISFFSTLILAFTRSKYVLYFTLFCVFPIGTSMGIPMLTVGIKRYTTALNRGFAFGLFYAVMNIAAFVSGPVVDLFNITFSSGVKIGSLTLSGNRLVILTTTVTYAISIFITYNYLREIKVSEHIAAVEGDTEENIDDIDSERCNTDTTADLTRNNSECSGTSNDSCSSVGSTARRGRTSSGTSARYSECKGGNDEEDESESVFEEYSVVSLDNSTVGVPSMVHATSAGSMAGGSEYRGRNDSTASITPLMARSSSVSSSNGNTDDVESGQVTRNPLISSNSTSKATEPNNLGFQHRVAASPGENGAHVEEFKPESRSLCSTAGALLKSPTFWRFSVFTLFLVNLSAIFRHLDATLPTYLIRCFGANYPKGMIYSINPFMIIWLTPIVAALTTTSAHYDMIKYGGYVSAISPLFMACSTSTWAVVTFVVLLSLGEAVWCPRVYGYTMSIAPEGREASFSALAAAPLFAAKVPVGLLSGYLLSTYIPEGGSHPNGRMLWFIIGVLTMSSPIMITVFESCVREPTPSQSAPSSSPSKRQHQQLQQRDVRISSAEEDEDEMTL